MTRRRHGRAAALALAFGLMMAAVPGASAEAAQATPGAQPPPQPTATGSVSAKDRASAAPRDTPAPLVAFARNFAAEPGEAGTLTLQLDFDSPPAAPRVEQLADGRIVIDLPTARSALGRSAERLAHPLARQVRFGQHDGPTRLRIVVDAVPGAGFEIRREAKQLEILLTPPGSGAAAGPAPRRSDASPGTVTLPVPTGQSALAPGEVSAAVPRSTATPGSTAVAAEPTATTAEVRVTPTPAAPRSDSSVARTPAPGPTPATISLHFVDADAASVVRLVAEAGGLSVRLPPGRPPPLTIALRDVTPRVALERIGHELGWTIRSQGDALVFAPAEPAPGRSLEAAP